MALNILKLPDVMLRTSLSRSSIYYKMSEGSFPRSIGLGPRSVGWLDTEIDEWIDSRITLSRSPSVSVEDEII